MTPRRLFVVPALTLAAIAAGGCGETTPANDATPPGAQRPSAADDDAPTLLANIRSQLDQAVDRASAVRARQAIEVQLRLLRQKLPQPDEHATAPTSVFTGALAGQQATATALLARAEVVMRDADCAAILGPYVTVLRDLLK
jgi:hypothetical protein